LAPLHWQTHWLQVIPMFVFLKTFVEPSTLQCDWAASEHDPTAKLIPATTEFFLNDEVAPKVVFVNIAKKVDDDNSLYQSICYRVWRQTSGLKLTADTVQLTDLNLTHYQSLNFLLDLNSEF